MADERSHCSCAFNCRTRAEMRSRHGTPERFDADLWRAIGEISHAEATRASAKYRAEYAAAPEGGDDAAG
jgi:hypothetical protein